PRVRRPRGQDQGQREEPAHLEAGPHRQGQVGRDVRRGLRDPAGRAGPVPGRVRLGGLPQEEVTTDPLAIYLLTAFNGLSIASILLLVSLGLAFSFGLMNVINMAHGELIMVGAYVAYLFG